MILDRLAKLDKRKRISGAVLAVLVAVCICYFAITRNFLVKLQSAKADFAGIQTAFESTENQQAELSNLQKQFEEEKKQLLAHQQRCFSTAQASRFFENINAAAAACNLKPLSRIISEPKEFIVGKETKPKQKFLKIQSAKISVSGKYFDIIDFLNELTERPQRVGITNLNITLPNGEERNPNAVFEIIIFIDSSKDVEK